MDQSPTRTAVIIGGSSGIGEALARKLSLEGWTLGLAARRSERLQSLAGEISGVTSILSIDLADVEQARSSFEGWLAQLGQVDLIIISAGIGHVNETLEWNLDSETITVNTLGFAAMAQAAFRHFEAQGGGHLVGISSIAKLRANGGAASYCASKAFVSCYLDGLRDLARTRRADIAITEICPGFVDTAMMKAEKPFWVTSPARAAEIINRAIQKRSRHAYVSRRWGVIGMLLKLLP